MVEVRLDINGLSCVLSDTAGIRYSANEGERPIDEIELEGIRRSMYTYTHSTLF